MFKKTRVNTFYTQLFCDECNLEMMREGYVMMSDPPRYSYVCRKCGKKVVLTDQYPKVEYIHRRTIREWFNSKKK